MSNTIPSLQSVEDKVTFRYVKHAFKSNIINNCLELKPRDKNQLIDESNLPREKDRFLLRLLESLGIDYEISFRNPTCVDDMFLERRPSTTLKMYIPETWSSDYQAISRRIAEFEAKQHIYL
ncbi:MAG: hypothetical protein AABX35_00485 [Nanoarchaeota archaeon]